MATVLRSCRQRAQFSTSTATYRTRNVSRLITCAADSKQGTPGSNEAAQAPSTQAQPTFRREFNSWGARIVETDAPMKGPEDEKDFWEGENMEMFGRAMEKYFLPCLIVLGVICGSIAARNYNEDADVFIAPPTGPEADVTIIPAGALAPAPVVVETAPAPSSD